MVFLIQENIQKEKRLSLANHIQFLISLIFFTYKNLYRFMNGKDMDSKTFAKDPYFERISETFNFQLFLFCEGCTTNLSRLYQNGMGYFYVQF